MRISASSSWSWKLDFVISRSGQESLPYRPKSSDFGLAFVHSAGGALPVAARAEPEAGARGGAGAGAEANYGHRERILCICVREISKLWRSRGHSMHTCT